MPIHAFRMKLKEGMVAEYKRRQKKNWPHMDRLLRHMGIYDYSIFLDEETLNVFSVLKVWPDHHIETLFAHPLMQLWSTHMAELMELGPDNRPRAWPLESTFHFA